MKTTPRLSGPVLAFGIVGLIIIALIGWLGVKRRAASDLPLEVAAESSAARNRVAFGKAAAMNVLMQIIHHNQPKFRCRDLARAKPENVDDYRRFFSVNPFA